MNILNAISYHAVFDASIPDALTYAAANGFAGIQIAAESPHLSLDRMSEKQLDEIARTAEELGVYIVLHAVDNDASLFQTDRHLMAGIRTYYSALLDTANRISAKLITIHTGEMATFRTDSQPQSLVPEEDLLLYRTMFRENIEFLLDANRQSAIPLCVENYRINSLPRELLQPYLQHGDIFLCWDIAKSYGELEIEEFFLRHLPWIKQFHLHDRRKDAEGNIKSHCVIGTGEIDFSTYLPILSDAEILDCCIEVRPREKALESLENLKMLLS